MIPKLSLRQREFWKEYQKSHSLIKSAIACGSKGKDNASLSVIGFGILRSLNLQMPELLEAKGLSTDQLGDVLASQLKATKPIVATWEGKITDERFYPDNAAIGKAIEHLGRMHGVFVDRHELSGRDGGDIVLQVASAHSKRDNKQIDMDVD